MRIKPINLATMPKSYKHSSTKRAHIPSKEEAGYESANPNVQEGQVAEYDKNPRYFKGNPVDHRGKDPELWWMNTSGIDNKDNGFVSHSLPRKPGQKVIVVE